MKTKEEQQKYADVLKDFKETYIDHPENRAIAAGTSCRYKTEDGKKCAVGKYIPDELYDPSFEGNGIDYVYETIRKSLPVDDYDFWDQLQFMHDLSLSVGGIKNDYNKCIDLYCPDFQELKLV